VIYDKTADQRMLFFVFFKNIDIVWKMNS